MKETKEEELERKAKYKERRKQTTCERKYMIEKESEGKERKLKEKNWKKGSERNERETQI